MSKIFDDEFFRAVSALGLHLPKEVYDDFAAIAQAYALRLEERVNSLEVFVRKLAEDYYLADELRENSEEEYGLEYEETIEMVYDAILYGARMCISALGKKK